MTLTQTPTPARRSYRKYAVHVASGLARYPGAITSIGAVFRHDPALGVNRPWWNRGAISYLDTQPRSGQLVFEWGSGGSTAWFVEKGTRVTSVEHNPEWVEKVKSRDLDADIRTIPGMTAGVVAEPYLTTDLCGAQNRYFDDYIAAIDEFPDGSLDIVLVDGMCRADFFIRDTTRRGSSRSNRCA